MTKRSKRVAIAIIGATAFTLAGCRDEKIDAVAFPDVQSCKNEASFGGTFTAADCETAFAEAETLHVESAPRYNSLDVCEEQHGEGACGSEAQQTQGGSGGIFMPLLAGYLIGNMLGGRELFEPETGFVTSVAQLVVGGEYHENFHVYGPFISFRHTDRGVIGDTAISTA